MKKIFLTCIILTGSHPLLFSKKIPGIRKNVNLEWNLIFSEDFESGNLPNGWQVWENPQDGWTWQVGHDIVHGIDPPNSGTAYLYYCDYHFNSSYFPHTEEVRTGKYFVDGYNTFRFSIDYYLSVYSNIQNGIIEVNYKSNGIWERDTLLDLNQYMGGVSDTFYFHTYYPVDSIWFRFIFKCNQSNVHVNYGAFSADNLILEGAHYMSILFVDDDGGASDDTFFTNALNFFGLPHDTFVVPPGGDGPDSLLLSNYDIVIWNTGGEVTNTLTPRDTLNLKKYLTKRPNPHLWLSSQNLLSDLGKAPSWLKVSSFISDAGVSELKGIGPTTLYLNLTLGNNVLPDMADAIVPSTVADTEFIDTLTNNIFALSLSPSQTGYSLFFNSFPFENISSSMLSRSEKPTKTIPKNYEQTELTHRILRTHFKNKDPKLVRDVELLPSSPGGIVYPWINYNVIVGCFQKTSSNSNTPPATVLIEVYIKDSNNNIIFERDTQITFELGSSIWFGDISFAPGDYVFQGTAFYHGDDDYSNNSFTSDIICTEVAAGTSKPFTPPPSDQDRLGHTVVHDPVNNKIYMIGGTPDGWPSNNVDRVWRYDPLTDSWDQPTTMPNPAVSWTDGVYHNGKIHVFGGLTTSSVPTDRHIAYDIQTNQWQVKAPLPAPRAGHRVIKAGNYAYLIGGSDQNGPTNTVYRYDFNNDTWSACTPLPDLWTMGGADLTGDLEFTLFGGFNDNFGGKWNYALKGQIDPNNPDNINYSYGCPIPQEMQGSIGSNIMVSFYKMGLGAFFVLGGLMGQNDSVNHFFTFLSQCYGVYNQYVVPLARILKAVLIPISPIANKSIDTTNFRIYIFAGDAYGDWNPPNNYYYYIEGNAVGIKERINREENTEPVFLETNLIDDKLFLSYVLSRSANVDISLYNLTGRKVFSIIKNTQNRGKHKIMLNTKKLKSGIYFLKVKLNDRDFGKKIIKIK